MGQPREHQTVQARNLECAVAIGWTIVSREEAKERRAGFPTRHLRENDGQECRPSNAGIQMAGVLQWVLPPLMLFGVVFGAVRRGNQSRLVKETRQSGGANLGSLSWRQFEELLAGYFRERGFDVSSNTDAGPDGGVDLRLRRGGELHLAQQHPPPPLLRQQPQRPSAPVAAPQ